MAQDGPGRVREAAGAAPHGAARGPGSGPPSVRRVSVSLRRAWAPHGVPVTHLTRAGGPGFLQCEPWRCPELHRQRGGLSRGRWGPFCDYLSIRS